MGYALLPARLVTCSPKVSLGPPCSSPCSLSDPGGPVSCQVLYSPIQARVCWNLAIMAALWTLPRTHRPQPFPLLMALHVAGSKARQLYRAPGTKAKPSIATVSSLGPGPHLCGVRDTR